MVVPTATVSPTSAPSHTTFPSTGEGISTVALSVITAPSTSSSRTTSPTLTFHSTSSASATPSPTSGSLMTYSPMSGLHDFAQCAPDARRAGKIIPFLRMRVRRVPAGDAHDRRLQVIEAVLLDEGRELRAEAAGQRRLVHDDTTPRLPDRGCDRVEIVRNQCPQVDDLGVHAGFLRGSERHMHHRAVGEHRRLPAFAPDRRLAQRHDVVTGRHVAQWMLRPRCHGLFVMAVERTIIKPLRLEKDHRVRVLDGGDQEALCVEGVGGHDGFQPGDVGEQGLWALAVGLAAEYAAAGGHADYNGAGELSVGAVAQAGSFRHDLVVGRVDIIGELHFDTRSEPVGGHADCRTHDAELADRGVERAVFSVFLLEALRAAKHAAEIADILTEDDDVLVAAHGDIHGVADRLNHAHAWHAITPPPAGAAASSGAASRRIRPRTCRVPRAAHPRAACRAFRPPSARRSRRQDPRPRPACGALPSRPLVRS